MAARIALLTTAFALPLGEAGVVLYGLLAIIAAVVYGLLRFRESRRSAARPSGWLRQPVPGSASLRLTRLAEREVLL